ncbi:MAG: hypothetical protein JWM28_3529 [Chitinophagaceae bacterium]|nr:hypothetical protein [Chitinophagaceae bacterium]
MSIELEAIKYCQYCDKTIRGGSDKSSAVIIAEGVQLCAKLRCCRRHA